MAARGLGPNPGQNMNPGYASLGASAAGTERAGFGGSSAGSNGFDFNTKGLDDLATKLTGIISQFDELDKKIGSVSGKLGGLSGGGTSSGGSITAAGFASSPAAAQINKNLAQFPGSPTSPWPGSGTPKQNTPGPGGPNNTTAGFGAVGTTLATVAGVGAIAQGASWVGSKLSAMQAGGVPVQMAAAQQATITGGSTIGNVTAWNGVLNTGQGDQAQAMNMAMQNPFLSTLNPQSKNFNNMRGILNSTQKLGGVSATSAMGFLNDLTSTKATNFFAQISGGQAGAFDPRTGKLRNAQQTFLSSLQAATGTRGLTGNRLSTALKSDASRGGMWAAASQNFEQAGLSSSDITLMHELAAQGGNLTKAQGGQVSKTVGEQLLAQTTQGTATQNQLMQETSGLQVAFSKLSTTVSHLQATLAGWATNAAHGVLGGLASHLPVGGGIVGGALSMVSKIPGLSSIPGLGSILGDPSTGSTTTSGMQPNLAHGITAMKRANPNLQINSGHRSQSQQAALYAMKGGKGVASPGHSPHQLGKAADIGPPSQFGWIAANAQKFGLAPDRHEPWHIQAIGDPISPVSSGLSLGRTDQGVDWSGKGSVYAVDSGTILNLTNSGWQPGGAFIVLKLDHPPDSVHTLVYYAEQITPLVKIGQRVSKGQALGTVTGGIEIGWASTKIGQALAADSGTYAGEGATSQGQNFANWLKGAVASSGGSSSDVTTSSTGSSNSSGKGSAGSAVSTSLASSFMAQVGAHNFWSIGSGGGGGAGGGSSGGTGSSATSTNTASTGSTTLVGGGGGPISSPTGFSKAVLASLGLPATSADVTSLNAWQQMEGQWGAKGIYNAMQMHDPLNTNLPEKGGRSLGGTWFYPDWATGISATVDTIKQGNMAAIYNALKSNDNLASFGAAAESTPWAASAYGGKSWPAPSGTYAVGDPTGSGGFQPAGSSQSYGGPGPVSTLRSGGGRGVSVAIGPIYVQGTQADANNIANMVASAIKGHREIQAVAKS